MALGKVRVTVEPILSPYDRRLSITARIDTANGVLGFRSPPVPTMRAIAQRVADAHELTVADLTGKARFDNIVRARQEFMWLASQVKRPPDVTRPGAPKYTKSQIGRFLGGRDHSTVLSGIARHEARMKAAAE